MTENYGSKATMCDQLFKIYNKAVLTKKELASVLSVSVSYIDKSLARGYGVPNYIKLGSASNGKVVFNIVDVANYLSHTTKMG